MKETEVRWQIIPGYPKYRVSDSGEVEYRTSTNHHDWKSKNVKPRESDGYTHFGICHQGRCKKVYLHRLVAAAFIPNPEELPLVCHQDGNRSNNRATNLKWGTYADNENDKRRHGTYFVRGRPGKVTIEQVREIRRLGAQGFLQTEIAKHFDIERSSVGKILTGDSYGWVERGPGEIAPDSPLIGQRTAPAKRDAGDPCPVCGKPMVVWGNGRWSGVKRDYIGCRPRKTVGCGYREGWIDRERPPADQAVALGLLASVIDG